MHPDREVHAMANSFPILRVRDLISNRNLQTVYPEDNLALVNQIMLENRIRHVPVIDREDGTLMGIISHRDLVRHALFGTDDLPAYAEDDFLSKTKVNFAMIRDVETIDIDTDIRDAAATMLENKFGCLPVMEGGELSGILTESDFVEFVRSQVAGTTRRTA
jgi:CBS domain-containing protein